MMTSLDTIKFIVEPAAPGIAVEVCPENDGIYVNFDFDSALFIEPDDLEPRLLVMTALHWDRTHALDAEQHIGTYPMSRIADAVRQFLAEEEKRQRELEEHFASLPDDIPDWV